MKLIRSLLSFWIITAGFGITASAFEMYGTVSYNLTQISQIPTNFVESKNGIGYNFFGRLDLGPGMIESGFMYTPVGIATTTSGQGVTTQGSYWIFPVMYRYAIFPPFFSVAAGLDYALVGNNEVLIGGTSITSVSSGYKSHFGYQLDAQATQDLGENLAAVLDVRYRGGLGNAIYFTNQQPSKCSFWVIGLGLLKYLE